MDAAQAKIQTGEAIIGYTFNDKRLLWQAIQTSGTGAVPKNTRLAVFGDTALNKMLCSRWFALNLSKGDWTTIRNVAQNSNLAQVGFEHGLKACVLLNDGTGDVSAKTMASTVEAILGAVDLDGGSEALMEVATRLDLVHPMLISG
ncbi:hypothetical protein GJ744_007133 [Endocarpon pusillum]|uniref:RNase III domain-containing protein n=1 Tax=Endocarpon pusillum TaxID=364733 RepID=A0A8H7AKW9_9EURO|nr:hypothetical protein GJ744_007133 [Endocarpon pusillum]